MAENNLQSAFLDNFNLELNTTPEIDVVSAGILNGANLDELIAANDINLNESNITLSLMDPQCASGSNVDVDLSESFVDLTGDRSVIEIHDKTIDESDNGAEDGPATAHK